MSQERETYDTLVAGGLAVLPRRGVVRADIGIRDGQIAAVAERLPKQSAGEVIDATGLHVLPGAIDPHLHFRYRVCDDDFLTETRFAAKGGVTTVIGMLREPESYDQIFPAVRRVAEERAFIDFGFHAVLLTEQHLANIPLYVRELGVSSFKFYVSYRAKEPIPHGLGPLDDGYMLEAFERIAAFPDCMVIVHAEDTEITSRRIDKARAAGQDGVAAWFAARPLVAEVEGCRRTLYFAEATGCRVTILHLTSGAALAEIMGHRSRYQNVFVETCIPYLTHNRANGTPLGNLIKLKPPLREQADNDALWAGLAKGDIAWVGSDNVPRKSDEKQGAVWDAAPGVPGTGLVLPVILSEGVNKGRLTLERAVEVTSTDAARAYNLLPRKGAIEVSGDADLAIVDLKLEREVHASDLGGNADYSIYEGWRLKGWPVHTICRGVSVMRDGEIVGSPGFGRYLPRHGATR